METNTNRLTNGQHEHETSLFDWKLTEKTNIFGKKLIVPTEKLTF